MRRRDFIPALVAGADAYLFRHIIHDWTDEQSKHILGHCRKVISANGKLLIGEKGFILSNVNNQVFPEACAKEAEAIEHKIPKSAGHYKEWIAACKGGPKAGSNFDWAGPLAESVLLGNVALRVQLREDLTLARLLWDSAQLKFTNLEDANKFIRREYRAG